MAAFLDTVEAEDLFFEKMFPGGASDKSLSK